MNRALIFSRSMLPIALALLFSVDSARAEDPASPKQDSKIAQTGKAAGDIAVQPARDVGVAKTDIPKILIKAANDPYRISDAQSCKQIGTEIRALNEVLGPDFSTSAPRKKENRAGKLAEAGGKTIVNSLVPFRGLVREITGAAPAQRRYDAAIDAGFARRGFLRGVQQARRCR